MKTIPAKVTVELPRKKKGKSRAPGKRFEKGNKWAIKKGEVRNPLGNNGRGKGITILSEASRDRLQQKVSKEIEKLLGLEDVTWAEALVLAAAKDVITNGNMVAFKELREITEGKTPETIYLQGGKDKEGEPLPVNVVSTLNINFVDAPVKK
jgi:ABC-type hemin transport system ATPase subunit